MSNLIRSDETLWTKCPAGVSSKSVGTHELTKRDVIVLLEQYYYGVDVFREEVVEGITITEHLLAKVEHVLNFIRTKFSKETTIYVNRVTETDGIDVVQQLTVISEEKAFAIIYSNDYRPITNLLANSEIILSLALELRKSPHMQLVYGVVIQPNCKNSVIEQPISADQVLAATKILVEKSKQKDVYSPGKHCEDCSFNDHCEQQTNFKKVNIMNYESLITQTHGDVSLISQNDLGSILDMEELFVDAFSKAKAEALNRNEKGVQTTGWHFANGKGRNTWNLDDEEISKKLRAMKLKKDEIYPSKLMSPSQARKVEGLTDIQKKNLEKLIDTIEGKPKLVKNDFDAPKERILIQF